MDARRVRYKLLHKRVLVQRSEAIQQIGKIVIPTCAQEYTDHGTVLNCAEDVTSVCVGQSVIFRKYSGTDVMIDNIQWLILQEDDILAVIEE